MTQPKTTRIPAPVYAAAGAGELAYRQLLKLPALANELSGKAAGNGAELRAQVDKTATDLRERAVATSAELRERANTAAARLRAGDVEMERIREAAMRNAAAFVAGAQAAQEKATAVYTALVARGERVVGTGVVTAADTVNADMEATEAPAAIDAKPTPPSAPAKKTVAKKTVAKKASSSNGTAAR